MLIFSLVLVSCGPSKEEMEAASVKLMYQPGQIVHLKPDSGKVAIISGKPYLESMCGCGPTPTTKENVYTVRDSKGVVSEVPESLIFPLF